MKKIYLSILGLMALSAFGQNEAKNWFFGYKAGITFNADGSVTKLAGSSMITTEGSSAISDSDGNLLFYTDGRTVWDRNHKVMPNGNYEGSTGLFGDPSSTQSALIVPKKDNPSIYYIFTVDEPHQQNATTYPNPFTGSYVNPAGSVPADDDGLNHGLNYSVVDLSVTGSNGSIGDVVSRNNHLVTYDPTNLEEIRYKCSEKLAAVSNTAKTGYWVLTHFKDKFYAFEVTASGVGSPVISQEGPIVPTSGYRRNAIGAIKLSPNGQKLAVAHNQKGTVSGAQSTDGGVYLYDFNPSAGIVSNEIIVSETTTPYSLEFSPKATKLYVTYEYNSSIGGQYQYDLLSADITNSAVQIGVDNDGMLQLAPNGKIYKAQHSSQFLAVINNPEETGALSCAYDSFGLSIEYGMAVFSGLPQFVSSSFNLLSTTESHPTTKFSVYPNPGVDFLQIANPQNVAIKAISIINNDGRTVLIGDDYELGKNQINITGLSTGLYFLNIATNDGAQTVKFLKK